MVCTIVTTGEELKLVCKNEYEPPYPQLKAKLREKIWALFCQGYDRFFVNCEYGVPLWAAEIICALKMYNDIELYIAMPNEEQSVNWPESFRDRYFSAHEASDEVIAINNAYCDSCYDEADEYMIEHSDTVLVCGDYNENLYSVRLAKESGINCDFFKLL